MEQYEKREVAYTIDKSKRKSMKQYEKREEQVKEKEPEHETIRKAGGESTTDRYVA